MRRLALILAILAMALPASADVVQGFTDINNSVHRADILTIAEAGVTKGCTPTRYCPDNQTTRGQMAAFLYRASGTGVEVTGTGGYDDVRGTTFQLEIATLEWLGWLDGCTQYEFCPDEPIDRRTMARWLHDAGECPFRIYADPVFDDVGANDPDRGFVEGCWSVGVLFGHDGRYFPDGKVTREQMASFLVRAWDL